MPGLLLEPPVDPLRSQGTCAQAADERAQDKNERGPPGAELVHKRVVPGDLIDERAKAPQNVRDVQGSPPEQIH